MTELIVNHQGESPEMIGESPLMAVHIDVRMMNGGWPEDGWKVARSVRQDSS
jgi:hypothetical protein